jgi:hypothetical protein
MTSLQRFALMPQMITALTTAATTKVRLLDLPDRCSASFNALAIM